MRVEYLGHRLVEIQGEVDDECPHEPGETAALCMGGGLSVGVVCGGLGHEGSLVRNYDEKGSAPALSEVPIHRVIEERRFVDTENDRAVEGIHDGAWNDLVVSEFQGRPKAQNVKHRNNQEHAAEPTEADTRLGVWNRRFVHGGSVVPVVVREKKMVSLI
jgi:hypothetical protein